MKRQLIALSLLSAATLPMAAPAFATVSITEQEGSIKSIGTLNDNENYVLSGRVNKNSGDISDTFSFSIPEGGNYTFVLNGAGTSSGKLKNGKLSVFKIGRGIIKRFSIGNGAPSLKNLESGSYRITIEGESTSSNLPNVFYQANIITPRVNARNVTVDILSAQARDSFDSGRVGFSAADFFVDSSMNNVRKARTKVHGNNNKPVFNHRISHTMSPQDAFMLIKLDLKDHDPSRFDSDDRADINPSTKSHSITLKYYPTTRKIINTSDNKRVGTAGIPFALAGTNGPKATLNLKISHANQ